MNALDQKRVDACVNACAGTTTADLVQIAANGGWQNLSVEWKLEAEAHADNADSFADRITELEQQRDDLLADAERLNFLDSNLRMKMGWSVTAAPAGNISVKSVIQPNGATSIRSAIDAAIAKAGVK